MRESENRRRGMIPGRDEFTSPDEVIVEVHGEPDNFDRSPFTAYWRTDQEWVPGGVRAQVFHTSLAGFTDRAKELGQTVRIIDDYPPCPICGHPADVKHRFNAHGSGHQVPA